MTFKRRFDGGGIWKSSIIYVNSGLRYLCFPRSKWAYEKMKMVVMKRRGAVLRLSVRNVVVETGGTGFWCAYSVIQGMISHVLICRDSTLWCFLNSATRVLHVSQLVLICTELHFFLSSYHMHCLRPTLNTRPEGDWVCPECAVTAHVTGKSV